jgi:hypothetical protein
VCWGGVCLRRMVLGALGGGVVDAELGVAHPHEQLRGGERLQLDPGQEQRLDEILAELVAAAEVESGLIAA